MYKDYKPLQDDQPSYQIKRSRTNCDEGLVCIRASDGREETAGRHCRLRTRQDRRRVCSERVTTPAVLVTKPGFQFNFRHTVPARFPTFTVSLRKQNKYISVLELRSTGMPFRSFY